MLCSRYFDVVFTVNQTLKKWHQIHLKTKNIEYVPNFVSLYPKTNQSPLRNLEENILICVANLRVPKNHYNLITAFADVYKAHPDWKLQLIGKEQHDDYSKNLRLLIATLGLEKAVTILGEQKEVNAHLDRASIGVLSSDMEGLPMSLLEYALSGLPVVCTDVGYCKEVVQGYGKVVPPGDSNALAEALLFYIQNPNTAAADAVGLQKHVVETYTEQAVLPQVIDIYERLLKS